MNNLIKKITLTVLMFIGIALYTQAQTVYITDNGKKYHAKNCSLAKTGKKGIELSAAKKQGYEPCKNCKADAIKTEEKKSGTPPKKK